MIKWVTFILGGMSQLSLMRPTNPVGDRIYRRKSVTTQRLREGENKEALVQALSIYLEEYKVMREEIVTHINAQNQLILYSTVLTAAAIPVAFNIVQAGFHAILLLVSIVFSALAFLHLWYEVQMMAVGYYIGSWLRPKVNHIVMQLNTAEYEIDELLVWEAKRLTTVRSSLKRFFRPLGMFQHGVILLPCIASTATYLHLCFVGVFSKMGAEIALLILNLLMLGTYLLLLMARTILRDRDIKRMESRAISKY